MNNAVPRECSRIKDDATQLKLLTIFHFIGSGLAVIGLGFLLLHYSLVSMIFTNPQMWEGQKSGPPPQQFFTLFKWFYVIGGGFLIASAVTNLLSGLWIKARKNRIFSLIVAGFNCMHMPLGTMLGVFTMVVLMRDSVRGLYEGRGGYSDGVQK